MSLESRIARTMAATFLLLALGCQEGFAEEDDIERGPDIGAEDDVGAEAADDDEGWDPGDGATDADEGTADGDACEPTAPNILGPYYIEVAPERSDLVEDGMTGTRLTLTGLVRGTDCAPIPEALLDFWQANDAGEYDNVGWTLRGKLHADAEGRWVLHTIVPGRYGADGVFRPEHIHVRVSAPGFPLLTTQLYFPDDPFAATDPFFLPSLVVVVSERPDGSLLAAFDFVLTPSEVSADAP